MRLAKLPLFTTKLLASLMVGGLILLSLNLLDADMPPQATTRELENEESSSLVESCRELP